MNGAAITDEHRRRLSWAFLMSFGSGWHHADSITERDAANFTALAERQAPRIRAALAEWAESVSLDLLVPPQEQQVRAFTNLVLVCPQIAVLECSRQAGFLGGYFSFAIDGATVSIPEAVTAIGSDAIGDLVDALNRRMNLLSGEESGRDVASRRLASAAEVKQPTCEMEPIALRLSAPSSPSR